MNGHIIIVTKPGGAIDQNVIVIREEVDTKLYNEIVELASPITFLWPTDYKVVTQGFGINPQWYEQYGLPGHEGIDMRAPMGSPVRAAWDGVVVRNEMHGAYGWSIRIEAEIRGDIYEFIYAHFAEQSPLGVDYVVTKGQGIGFADSTGNSTGSHLHFSLKKRGATASGETNYKYDLIDPTQFFAELRD
jgi:murein DD-endopeptidase MepM/ murein hydrolase activator NlpD